MWIIVLIVILVGGFVYFAYNFFNEDFEEPAEEERTYCDDSSSFFDDGVACVEVFEPVCGWFDISVQCLKEPCASTYSNSCFACADEKVEYYTEGDCTEYGGNE